VADLRRSLFLEVEAPEYFAITLGTYRPATTWLSADADAESLIPRDSPKQQGPRMAWDRRAVFLPPPPRWCERRLAAARWFGQSPSVSPTLGALLR